MDIVKQNILIAKYLGWEFYDNGLCYHVSLCHDGMIHPTDLQFHESWDWLMEAIQRIEFSDYVEFVEILGSRNRKHSQTCIIQIKDEYGGTAIQGYYQSNKMRAIYTAVRLFVRWFNDNVMKQGS